MPSLLLNVPMCDYVTVTSYSRDHWQTWKRMLKESVQDVHGYQSTLEESAWYQYAGWKVAYPAGGHAFVGSGDQGGKSHFLTYVSGSPADLWYLSDGLDGAKCTRLDLQITIGQPPGYSAKDMQEHARAAGLDPIYWPDASGELVTLYFGNLKGSDDCLTRLYQKQEDDGGKLLRLECNFRGKRAASALSLCKAGKEVSGIIAAAMPQFEALVDMFIMHLAGKVPTRVARVEHNTANWLKKTVLPSFTRYINSHEADPEVAELFFHAIDKERRMRI